MFRTSCLVLLLVSTIQVAQAGASRSEICRVNPAACQAMARNDSIRAKAHSDRCRQLIAVTKTMREPARSYQFRKLRSQGC